MHESFLVPSDFADDLPASFLQYPGQPIPRSGTYRLVPLVELSNALMRLPPMWQTGFNVESTWLCGGRGGSTSPDPFGLRKVGCLPAASGAQGPRGPRDPRF